MPDDFNEDTLKALLSDEIRSARNEERTDLSLKREKALQYYQGEMPDTPAQANRSQVVSMDVATTIGWMQPGIIRVFTASDRFGVFEPQQPGDEDYAEQASDYANHVFYKDNDGYRILWNATYDSLLFGDGIVKHYWDTTEDCDYTEHSGLTAEQVALLLQDEDVEVVAQKEGEPQIVSIPDEMGQLIEQPISTFDLKIKRVHSKGRLCVESIEPEDFYIDEDAILTEDARFAAHRREVTRSDLVEMGFDKEIIEGLPAYSVLTTDGVDLARQNERVARSNVANDSMTLVELFECYVKADMNGDGIAETIRAYYAGDGSSGEILDWEVWDDDLPFSSIPCEPMPHRWESRSITDNTIDVQRVKTVITRKMMDNLYWVADPLKEVEEGTIVNPEMLANPKFGGVVKRKQGSNPIIPHEHPFIADKMLLALQHWDEIIEKRTGVSRSMMALDPEALQNQTATANQNLKDAAYSQVELIARNQAELGWKRVFRQILKLSIKHQDRPRTIRLRDEWVDVDPRPWNARMDVTVNVGLGTGSRERDMAMLTNVQNTQVGITDRLAGAGLMEEAVDMVPKIINTAKKTAESAGLRSPDDYYPDFGEEELAAAKQKLAQKAQQPDPKVQLEQAKMQMDAELEKVRAERQRQTEQAQMEADLHVKDAEFRNDMAKFQAQQALEREKMQQHFDIEMAKLAVQRDKTAADNRNKQQVQAA